MEVDENGILYLIDKNICEYSDLQYAIVNGDVLSEGYSIFSHGIGKYYENSKILANRLTCDNYLYLLNDKSKDVRCSILTLIRDSFTLYDSNVSLMECILNISVDGSDEERVIVNTILTKEIVDFYKKEVDRILVSFVENSGGKCFFDYYTFNYLYELLVRFESKDLIDKLLVIGENSNINGIKEACEEIIEDLITKNI
ncbi:hypothetical protein [Acinetobacter proteolyticus]|uniref:Uncharacterized protein n=1 Tax=Acinetobacter proteolyticus TaxID=1776741 RepID=A0A2N0WAM5_9GAMM|nr:hypothetical protein [Acinetobacter proteolyticus]PKF31557.1 hypothetical protein CW311_17600 [Acinetobacter proteolyticus]